MNLTTPTLIPCVYVTEEAEELSKMGVSIEEKDLFEKDVLFFSIDAVEQGKERNVIYSSGEAFETRMDIGDIVFLCGFEQVLSLKK